MNDSRLARQGVSNDSQANASRQMKTAGSDSLDQGLARLDRAVKRLAWLTTFGPPQTDAVPAAEANGAGGQSTMAALEAELAGLRAAYAKLQGEHNALKSAYADLDAARTDAGQRLTAVIDKYRTIAEAENAKAAAVGQAVVGQGA